MYKRQGYVYTGNTSHVYTSLLSLLLLVLRIFANDHNLALALDDLALFANFLDGRLNFCLLYTSRCV